MSETMKSDDPVNPRHYDHLPVQAIDITENFSFCLGNVIKYVWRHQYKNGLEDLKKAQWYLSREIKRLEEQE